MQAMEGEESNSHIADVVGRCFAASDCAQSANGALIPGKMPLAKLMEWDAAVERIAVDLSWWMVAPGMDLSSW